MLPMQTFLAKQAGAGQDALAWDAEIRPDSEETAAQVGNYISGPGEPAPKFGGKIKPY